MLIKNANTDAFRLIGSGEASSAQVPRVYLTTVAQSAKRTSVMWRNIKIRAHGISESKPETVSADPKMLLAALATQLTGDLPKHALEFDGSNYVTVPSFVYDGTYPITLEAYVTHDQFGSVVVGDTQQSGLALGVPSKKYNMHAWIGQGYKAATYFCTAQRERTSSRGGDI